MEFDDSTLYKACGARNHKTACSKYPKEKVPLEMFISKNYAGEIVLNYCSDCRNYQKEVNARFTAKLRGDNIEHTDPATKRCISKNHGSDGSPHKRESVPVQLFRKVYDDPKSHLLSHCLHCRTASAARGKERILVKKQDAILQGKFYCTNCHRVKELSDRAVNIDGSPSILCLLCKDIERKRQKSIRTHYVSVKTDMILASGVSCLLCRRIYLKSIMEDSCAAIAIQCFEDEGELWASYLDTTLPAKEFVEEYKEYLETRIVELDHLTETEQRDAGMLTPEEQYVKKRNEVSKMSSLGAIKLESAKCRHLCTRCHLEETIRREKGKPWNDRTYEEREKLKVITELKTRKPGCVECGYWNPNLPRFFDLDHIDPSKKTNCISRMIKDRKYTLQDVLDEFAKCRVLCKHCHKIHSSTQDNKSLGRGVNKKGLTPAKNTRK